MPGLESKGAAPLEGDYSTWSAQWKQSYDPSESDYNLLIRADETLNKLFVRNAYYSRSTIRSLSDGTVEAVTSVLNLGTELFSLIHSVLRKYFAYVVTEAGVPKLKIYKDGSLIQTIDLSQAPVSWTNTTATYQVTFSPDGKYILVDNTWPDEYALFRGS